MLDSCRFAGSKKRMILHARHCSASGDDSGNPGILACSCPFEVANLRDANRFGEAQNLPVMRANLINAMAVIRQREAPAQAQKFLRNMFVRIDISAFGDQLHEPCLFPHSGMAPVILFEALPS